MCLDLDQLERDHLDGKHDAANGGPEPDCELCQLLTRGDIMLLAIIADEIEAHLNRKLADELRRAVSLLRQTALKLQLGDVDKWDQWN